MQLGTLGAFIPKSKSMEFVVLLHRLLGDHIVLLSRRVFGAVQSSIPEFKKLTSFKTGNPQRKKLNLEFRRKEREERS